MRSAEHSYDQNYLRLFEEAKIRLQKEIDEVRDMLCSVEHQPPYLVHGGTSHMITNLYYNHSVRRDKLSDAFLTLMSSDSSVISSNGVILVLRPNEEIPFDGISTTMESHDAFLPDQESSPVYLFSALETVYLDVGHEAFKHIIDPVLLSLENNNIT